MKNTKNNFEEEVHIPLPSWDAEAPNLEHRIENAAKVARDHLEGYTDSDIDLIWELIKAPLFCDREKAYRALGETHPPVDRLFDIAYDIEGYTNSLIEGDIEPATICAVYALKTIEYTKTADNILSSSLICIDAWRALAFVPRANYLRDKFDMGYKYNAKGRGPNKGRDKNNAEFNRLQQLVFDVYKEIFDDLSNQKKSGVLTPKDEYNQDRLGSGDLKFTQEYVALEINHLLVERRLIDEDELETDRIMRMINNYHKQEKMAKLISDIRSKGIALTDGPLRWPARAVKSSDADKEESFKGEYKTIDDGNHKKFKSLIKQRANDRENWELIQY